MKPATDASILAAALIVSLVWLSPARALADELPTDTNQIESLTPEQATALAGSTAGWVRLPNLTSLDAATAKTLAEFKGQELFLGLTSLDADVAETLAEFKGKLLRLNGLTTLDADLAKTLAGATAWDGRVPKLTTLDIDIAKTLAALDKWDGNLSSIVAIESPDSVEIAAALATRKGPLRLPNLKKISPKTLTALIEKEDVVIPLIETLELIQEPDGSPTEDFVIPKGFQARQKARQQGR